MIFRFTIIIQNKILMWRFMGLASMVSCLSKSYHNQSNNLGCDIVMEPNTNNTGDCDCLWGSTTITIIIIVNFYCCFYYYISIVLNNNYSHVLIIIYYFHARSIVMWQGLWPINLTCTWIIQVALMIIFAIWMAQSVLLIYWWRQCCLLKELWKSILCVLTRNP